MASVDDALISMISAAFDGKISIPAEQEAQIGKFLPGANLEIFAKALAEVKGVASKKGNVDIIPHLHRVYHRKLAEQASLYPIFHIFETSYRSFLAFWMQDYYGTVEWWKEHYDRLVWMEANRSKAAPPRIDKVNGKLIANRVSFAIENFVLNVAGPQLSSDHLAGVPSAAIFNRSKLSDLEALIEEQWPQISVSFPTAFPNGMVVTQYGFVTKFRYVRDARNTSFHHREVPARAMVMSIAEELLDMIDVHLGTTVEHIKHSTPKRLSTSISQASRHRTLEPNYPAFDVSFSYISGTYEQVTLNSYCSGSAMSRFIGSLDAEKLRKLSEIKAMAQVVAVAAGSA